MSKKKKKKTKAAEVTNIFNITIEGSGRKHAVFDDEPFDEEFMEPDFMDDCECNGDCEHCEYYSDDFDDDFEDDAPAIVRFEGMKKANLMLYKSFKPDEDAFDYLDENPRIDNLAQEVSRISDISNIMAFLVLEAEDTVSSFEEIYEDLYEYHSRYEYISILTGIDQHTVIEVLTVAGVIRKQIEDSLAEARSAVANEVDDDEPF